MYLVILMLLSYNIKQPEFLTIKGNKHTYGFVLGNNFGTKHHKQNKATRPSIILKEPGNVLTELAMEFSSQTNKHVMHLPLFKTGTP